MVSGSDLPLNQSSDAKVISYTSVLRALRRRWVQSLHWSLGVLRDARGHISATLSTIGGWSSRQ